MAMKTLARRLCVPMLALVLLAFGPEPAPVAPESADPVVTIGDFTFQPPVLTVTKGTRVRFVNSDDIPHTVTSALHPPLFRSPPLDTGEITVIEFDNSGTFAYFCSLHPHMHGSIVVK
jgi:plastocyanin